MVVAKVRCFSKIRARVVIDKLMTLTVCGLGVFRIPHVSRIFHVFDFSSSLLSFAIDRWTPRRVK